MTIPNNSPLGRSSVYADRYDPGLLFAMPRAPQRTDLGLEEGAALPFDGIDIWNAYELSWLDGCGKPQLALAEFRMPATAPNMIESKSLKLYLNSFAQTPQISHAAVQDRLQKDVSEVAGAPVEVTLQLSRIQSPPAADLVGTCIDDMPLVIDHYGPPHADYLRIADAPVIEEVLCSDLLRSNCPVTGQPDWGSIQIAYAGAPIDRAGLLRYLVSFRTHSAFHEHCVERIFMDIRARCVPQWLTVYARYTRRGGLDINPWRSSRPGDNKPPNRRTVRQ